MHLQAHWVIGEAKCPPHCYGFFFLKKIRQVLMIFGIDDTISPKVCYLRSKKYVKEP